MSFSRLKKFKSLLPVKWQFIVATGLVLAILGAVAYTHRGTNNIWSMSPIAPDTGLDDGQRIEIVPRKIFPYEHQPFTKGGKFIVQQEGKDSPDIKSILYYKQKDASLIRLMQITDYSISDDGKYIAVEEKKQSPSDGRRMWVADSTRNTAYYIEKPQYDMGYSFFSRNSSWTNGTLLYKTTQDIDSGKFYDHIVELYSLDVQTKVNTRLARVAEHYESFYPYELHAVAARGRIVYAMSHETIYKAGADLIPERPTFATILEPSGRNKRVLVSESSLTEIKIGTCDSSFPISLHLATYNKGYGGPVSESYKAFSALDYSMHDIDKSKMRSF